MTKENPNHINVPILGLKERQDIETNFRRFLKRHKQPLTEMDKVYESMKYKWKGRGVN